MARNMSTVAVRQMSSDTGIEDSTVKSSECSTKPRLRSTGPPLRIDEIARLRRQADRLLLVQYAELDEQIGEAHLLRLVDDQAHGALFAVGAHIDDGAREAVVLHAGHGDEELIVKKAAHRLPQFSPQKVHR